ncbi:hypothetical protein acsn021_35150 [Anaerocolumna cellulosilytica]|uniref:Uncharacterized protein n=1 Tax=Anaerocolumna cellulosilytica TaxID=433286 RepID=A0A6S6R1I8_9FIRM|nr:hypothetical protein acsn021_35150 [Anaerocolumna cellulosilytica]
MYLKYYDQKGDIFIQNIKSAIIKSIIDIDDNVMAHLLYTIKKCTPKNARC